LVGDKKASEENKTNDTPRKGFFYEHDNREGDVDDIKNEGDISKRLLFFL
jgi:hypothetical protein